MGSVVLSSCHFQRAYTSYLSTYTPLQVRVCYPSAIRLLCYLPIDGALWYTGESEFVPYIRLTRLLVAPGQVLKVLGMAERSQSITFVLARMPRRAQTPD